MNQTNEEVRELIKVFVEIQEIIKNNERVDKREIQTLLDKVTDLQFRSEGLTEKELEAKIEVLANNFVIQ